LPHPVVRGLENVSNTILQLVHRPSCFLS
jgi:hypothetical protein